MATGSNEPRFDRDEKQILLFTGVAHALTHYVELTYPTLAVILAAEAGLPLERVLGWSLLGYVLFGVGALPAGLLADRIGGKRIVIYGQLLAAGSAFAAAMASPGWPLVLCLAGMGLGASTYHPAGIGLLSRAIRSRGVALGINGIYGNVGIALAPLTTAALAGWLGWRTTFVITGCMLLVAAAAGNAMRFPEPPPVEADAPSSDTPGVSSRQVVAFAILCTTALLGGFAYRANTLSQPALFAERIDVLDFGLAASLAMLAGIAGQYLGGRIADRFPLAWSYLAFHALSLPMLILIPATTQIPLLAVAALYVFFALGMQPMENSLFAQLTPERWRSTAYGLKFTLTFGVGASAVGMVQWVAAAEGLIGVYRALIGVVALLIASALLLALVQRRSTTRQSSQAPAPAATPS